MIFELKNLRKDIYLFKLEDGRETEVHMAVLDKCEMWTKQEIDEETLTEILKKEAEYVLTQKAESLLGYRTYSRKEFFDKLYKYEKDREIRNAVLDKFEEYGLIDDTAYAARCAEYFITSKHLSLRETKNRMMFTRGIPSDMAEDALADYDYSDAENLEYLIDKKYYRYFEDSEDKKEVFKGKAALLRLGFEKDDIDAAVYDYMND